MAKRTLLTEIYNSVPTIPYEGDDEPIHTEEHPYCEDPECPCLDDYYEEMRRLHDAKWGATDVLK